MIITIIGTGNMAKGIATRLLAGGHSIELHGRDQAAGQALAKELGSSASAVKVGSPLSGGVVVLAIPYSEVANVAATYGSALDGKIVVDIANPLDMTTFELATPPGISAAEQTSKLLPKARVVKAFNTTFAGTLVTGQIAGQPLDVFVAGDDAAAKQTVMQLAREGGLRPLDVGALSHAHHLEAFQALHIGLQSQLGNTWMSTVKILQEN